ncbi:MAG: hypothetical protein DMD57_13285 [Gemmatimonadetes bacterium]|nr:MAG: hypothetical protein DMD57_13285 [Gemmatimonadota bacterium]
MNVTCQSCETVYRVDPSKVPAGGVRARCAVCSNVFPVAPKPPPVAPAAPAPAPAPPRAPAMPRFSGPIAAPTSAPTPPAAPARAAPPPAPRAAPPPAAPILRQAAPPPAPPPAAPPLRPAPSPAARAPVAPAAPAAPAPPAAPAGATPGRMTGPLRPVNPFMVQDPKQKARRLARALVSDLVVYHPEKRQQGLRDGTLPQLFKDEIDKSWQEYVEQVGADLAKTTPFWAEALNEILAGGNKVF